VLIPKSIPTKLSVLVKVSGKISTTKLGKYPLAESLIIVTDDGTNDSFLYQIILTFPILAFMTLF
ncbi:MAG: hypothetical protein O4753_02575, partial [Trichodesmium sp. St7_bin2_1]|nr:hypothetical protein [Trichodesmium sp. St7_bin2_1]